MAERGAEGPAKKGNRGRFNHGAGRVASPTSPKAIAVAERRAQALALRKAGWTYADIAKQLEVSLPMAHRYVKTAMEKLVSEPAEELRQLQIERLHVLLAAVWPEAVKNKSMAAIEKARKIISDLNELYGVQSPKKVELSGPQGGPIEQRHDHQPIRDPGKLAEMLQILIVSGAVDPALARDITERGEDAATNGTPSGRLGGEGDLV